MEVDWRLKMEVGDLIEFDEEFYAYMKKDNSLYIQNIGMITEVKDMFYCVASGDITDLWVTAADIKKINLDKASE
jgi:hypothetical protein